MSALLEIHLKLAAERFSLELAWSTEEPALGLFGPSGAGKTTLLELIAGLRRGARGRIAVRGRTWFDTTRGVDLPPERRGVGYVPQDSRLFPHKDVLGNILAGRRRAEQAGARRLPPERVIEVLELHDLARADVRSLSGGERQRVALARALCSGPDLLLLDEPLAGLDQPLRRRIFPYLLRVQSEFGIPTLHVSHDATEIKVVCREALILRQGRALARGRPEGLFIEPGILPMAWMGGFENVLRGRVSQAHETSATIDLGRAGELFVPESRLRLGNEAVVAVRADDLIVAIDRPTGLSAQNVLSGTVSEIRETGTDLSPDQPVLIFVALAPGATPLVASVTAESCRRLRLAVGGAVHLICKAQSCRLLAAS